MKSAMRRSLAMLLTVLMMLSVCALSLQMVVLAATTDMDDNQPCDCGAPVTTNVVAPTCVDLGGTWHTCSECAKKWVTDVQLPTGEHDFSVGGTHEATCTEDGSVGYFCSVCNAASPENTTTPALGHNYETVEIPSDCENGGTITETCSRCGDIKETTTPATGHVHVAGNKADVDYKAPSCSAEGFVNFTCSTCGDLVHAVFDKLEHAPNTVKEEPSCKDYGYEIGGVCTICGEVLDASKQLAKIDHDYKNLTATEQASNGEAGYQAPVCSTAGTTDGWQWQVCKVCGYENKVTQPASHNFVFKETVASNCATKSNGYDLYECSVCGTPEHRNEVAYAHKYPTSAIGVSVLYTFILKDASVATDAIVGSDGNSYYSFDGKSVYYTDDSSESYVGYEQVLWVVQRMPTKDLPGILVHACEICNVPAHLVIEIDHENPVYVSTVDPNCTEQGYDVYTCDCCVGGFKTNYTDPLGHRDYDGGRHKDCPTTGIKVDRVEPNCATGTKGMTEYYYCTDPACPVAGLYGATGTEIPATHTYTASTYTVPASCAFPSFVIQACTCGAIEYNLDTAAGMLAAWTAKKSVVSGSTYLGHDWTEESPYVVVEKERVEATCTTPGNEAFHKCTLCGDTDSLAAIVIPVLGENYVVKETVRSTCRVQGYTVYTCGNVDWENGETCPVHNDYTVYDDQHQASNGGHVIKGAVYNATTGRVDLSGATLLTAADLIALGVISSEAEYSTSWGSTQPRC
ncbi:MAG: hypothetical protein E7644_02935, partial [Ruminococcaceae bacterium]|nr:hypothetical protein [Oscillospiraceae bacterium]